MYNSYEDIEVRTSEEWIAKKICLSDNIDVPSDNNEPFWIMFVDKGPHCFASNFEDGWGNKWQHGDLVIRRY
jgi:hypothetical protein